MGCFLIVALLLCAWGSAALGLWGHATLCLLAVVGLVIAPGRRPPSDPGDWGAAA